MHAAPGTDGPRCAASRWGSIHLAPHFHDLLAFMLRPLLLHREHGLPPAPINHSPEESDWSRRVTCPALNQSLWLEAGVFLLAVLASHTHPAEGEFCPSHTNPRRMGAEQASIGPSLEQIELELGMTHSVRRPAFLHSGCFCLHSSAITRWQGCLLDTDIPPLPPPFLLCPPSTPLPESQDLRLP